MSEMAKEARAKMREKARRMTEAGDPNMKVDASSWMPTEQLNANAKTGLRPVSRRQFRKGGKVLGKESTKHAGKKPRVKMTGNDPITANSYLNRNVKEANAELGKPHVGGFRKGGAVKRKHKMDGGSPDGFAIAAQADRDAAARRAAAQAAKSQPILYLDELQSDWHHGTAHDDSGKRKKPMTRDWGPQGEYAGGQDIVTQGKKHGGKIHRKHRDLGGLLGSIAGGGLAGLAGSEIGNALSKNKDDDTDGKKRGGRAHKMDGGMNMSDPRAVAASRMAAANQQASVPSGRMGFQARGGQPMPMSGMKRGGKTHPDAAADKKLIKKAFRQHEDAEHGGKHVPLHLRKGGEAEKCWGGRTKKARGGDITPDEMDDITPDEMYNISPYEREAIRRVMRISKMRPDALDEEMFDKSARAKYMQQKYDEYRAAKDQGRSAFDRASGGKAEKWIGKAIKHPGALHKALHVPAGEKIPAKKLKKAEHSDNPKLAKRAHLAETLKKMHKKGGGVAVKEMGGNYTGGTRPTGGRIARATGGKAKGKGKTQINIVIGAGGHRPDMQQAQMMPPPGGPAPARPVAVPPPPMGGMPMGGMPMGGMPMPPQMPPPQMPVGRKSGGKVGHRSYKSTHDMDAGAGGGYGRIEKAEIYGLRPAKNR